MPEQNRGAAGNAGRAPSPDAIPPGSRPNIVLIVLDDLGYGDLSSYGSPIETPNADRIAREGMTFRAAYAGAAVCTPSRAALLTGRYAQRVGLPAVIRPGDSCGLPELDREWLFDLDRDPEESADLSGDPDHAEVLDRLRASAKQFDDEIQRDKDAALRRACPESSTND